MIKDVIFDFGGVVHSVEGISSGGMIAVAYGLKLDKMVPLYSSLLDQLGLGEISESEFWNNLSEKVGKLTPSNSKELLRNGLRENARLYPEVVNLIKDLRALGVGLNVLSNTNAPHAEVISEKGWYEMFDRVFLSHKIHLRKPDKKAYEYVLNKLGVKGSDCVYVDDLPENLIPAKELGMVTVLATNPVQVAFEVKKAIERSKIV